MLVACGGGGGVGGGGSVTQNPPQNLSMVPMITAPGWVAAHATGLSASVSPVAGITYAWTVTGGTGISGAGSPAFVFTAGEVGVLTLNCTATGAAGSGTGVAPVFVLAPQLSGYYGPGLNADSLANTPLGKAQDFQVSYRIRAGHTGPLQAIRPFFIWSSTTPGYALGTGGTIRIQLQTDDGSAAHVPSGTVLASLDYAGPVDAGGGFYPLLPFTPQPSLQAGSLYHLVFSNVDADPGNNWVSLDCAYMDFAGIPAQPTLADIDLAMLWRQGSGGAWSVRKSGPTESFTPIVELDYADGAAQGQGYMEFWIGDPKTISGTQGVRETFTISGADRVVASAAVRLKWISGSSPLTIRLEQGDGTLIDEQTVASVPEGPGLSGNVWAKATFAAPRTLAAGHTYHLALSAPADTVFTAFPMRKGSDQGFQPATVFTDGYAQFNPGSGWTGWDQWGQVNRTDGDLQFYFVVVQ